MWNAFWFFCALLVCSTVFNNDAVFASSDNWVEVATFTEREGDGLTNQFICNHGDWRIKWHYVPGSNPRTTVFTIDILSHEGNQTKTVYNVGDEGLREPTPAVFGRLNQTGTCYVTGHNGTFSLNILSLAKSYTIVIEENLDSIPEFSSIILLTLIFAGILFFIIVHKLVLIKNRVVE